MRYLMFFAVLTAAFAAVVACGSGGLETLDPSHELDASSGVIVPVDAGAAQGQAGSGLVTGLPCDVQTLLENRCIGCHDGTMIDAGAPRLLDYNDLVAASKSDAAKTLAQVALERMQSTTSPMPPPPADPANVDEIASMQDWVSSGLMRAGACTDTPPDAGGSDGSSDASADADATCTSGIMWMDNNNGSALMHPGVACLDCHERLGGPGYAFAGTVYAGPSYQEPDDCNGKAPPPTITITVTDKLGQKVMGTVNGAGNFMIDAPNRKGIKGARLVSPFSATLSDGTYTRSMVGTVSSGDCNSCHTTFGENGAPGRIRAPAPP